LDDTILTRMGDGSLVKMTRAELRADIEDGTQQAARRAKVPPLDESELDHIEAIFASNARFTGVDLGNEVILSYDGSGNADLGSRMTEMLAYQTHQGADMLELWHIDYSYKAIKTILSFEAHEMKMSQLNLTVPMQYGAMPDLGRYSKPDGPIPNWSELMPLGRIEEAREAQLEAVEMATHDMLFVADGMVEAGTDGLDFDTAGAAGDADFLATLHAVEKIREKYPDVGIEVGMASEFVLGMHGELEYQGMRLAGMWPHEQVKAVAAAGGTIYGPAVNVNTRKSVAWNVSRSCTLVKRCCEEATIPVHMNVGMGVGGVPMTPYPPVDAVSRVSKALVEVTRMDGL
jgi:dimethylamine--corrinoid protein Co-methyltransferase